MAAPDTRLPVTILTGFLGSGKTTLLNRLLREHEFDDAAVIVNEFGTIGIDNELVVQSRDRIKVLAGGCVCCAVREDIEAALRSLFDDRDSGAVPAFSRVLIETTGLADPIPLLMTLRASPLCAARLRQPSVVTTVDVVLMEQTLAAHVEATRQIVAADVLVPTKVDLATAVARDRVRDTVSRLNPFAEFTAAGDLADTLRRLGEASETGASEDRRFLGRTFDTGSETTYQPVHGTTGAHSFSMILDQPIDWGTFGIWLTFMLHRHGQSMLRVKGLIRVEGLPGPVAFHAAQHMVFPPQHLDAWPGDDHRSKIVFIVAGLSADAVRASLRAFVALADGDASRSDTELRRASKPAGAGGTVGGRPIRRPTAPSWIR